jgi:hypothetical protein
VKNLRASGAPRFAARSARGSNFPQEAPKARRALKELRAERAAKRGAPEGRTSLKEPTKARRAPK